MTQTTSPNFYTSQEAGKKALSEQSMSFQRPLPSDTPTCAPEPPCIEPQDILRSAADLISGPRAEQYGDWRTSFIAAASDAGVTTEDAIRVMIGVKRARLRQDPDHRDSVNDLAAYQAMLTVWQAEGGE